MDTNETNLRKELLRTRERDELKRLCGGVSLATTKQVAYAFSSGVDWGGSSKGLIFESMATTKPQGYHRNWEGFKAAMEKVAWIERDLRNQVYAKVVKVIKEVKNPPPVKQGFPHVADEGLREILEDQDKLSDPESVNYLVKSTIDAWSDDSVDQDIEPKALAMREEQIRIINSNWGNGEDGDALATKACIKYWS